jgi:hypothetical protein
MLDLIGKLSFGFWYLEFVWILGFAIWNLADEIATRSLLLRLRSGQT